MAGERSRRLPAAAACASCRLGVATSWLAEDVRGHAGAAAVGAVGRMRGPDGAPTSESREGRKEDLSSIGCRMRARLEVVFHRWTLKIKMRDWMRHRLELPLVFTPTFEFVTGKWTEKKLCLAWAGLGFRLVYLDLVDL